MACRGCRREKKRWATGILQSPMQSYRSLQSQSSLLVKRGHCVGDCCDCSLNIFGLISIARHSICQTTLTSLPPCQHCPILNQQSQFPQILTLFSIFYSKYGCNTWYEGLLWLCYRWWHAVSCAIANIVGAQKVNTFPVV